MKFWTIKFRVVNWALIAFQELKFFFFMLLIFEWKKLLEINIISFDNF